MGVSGVAWRGWWRRSSSRSGGGGTGGTMMLMMLTPFFPRCYTGPPSHSQAAGWYPSGWRRNRNNIFFRTVTIIENRLKFIFYHRNTLTHTMTSRFWVENIIYGRAFIRSVFYAYVITRSSYIIINIMYRYRICTGRTLSVINVQYKSACRWYQRLRCEYNHLIHDDGENHSVCSQRPISRGITDK